MERALTGYRVWRLSQGQEDNEAAWTSLTGSDISQTNYTDTGWQDLPPGVYSKYAVRAVYSNNAHSSPSFSNVVCKDAVIIGTETLHQLEPFNAWKGYGRSLGLYTAAQVGQTGVINTLGWDVQTTGTATIPYRIYAKLTTETELTQMTWADFASTATLVKEGSYTFNSLGWHQIILDTPFIYTGGNLLIGAEANYGGVGAGSYPRFYCSSSSMDSHQYWWQDVSAPTGYGTLDSNLPNLMLTLSSLPDEPALFLGPMEHDFGRREINTTATKTFTISNTGGGTLSVTGLTPTTNGFFSVTNAPAFPLTLATGQSASFTILYAPTAVGNHTATFTITDGRAATALTVSGVCFNPIISNFPYLQNFDGEWTGTPAAPEGWRVVNADNDSYTWRQANTCILPTHSEPYAAHGRGNTNDWLITPPVDLTGFNATMKWWDKVENSSLPNSYKVMVSTTTADVSAFTTQLTDITCNNTAWTEHTLDLSAYVGQTVYIAFHQYSSYEHFSFGIDDFLLEGTPLTPIFAYTPTVLDFDAVRINTATAYQNVTVTNTGTGILNLNAANVSIVGLDATMFEIDPSNLPFALTEGQSGIIPVRYQPTAEGVHNASLYFFYNGMNYGVALSGRAVGEYALMEGFEAILFPPYRWRVHNGGGNVTWFRDTHTPRTGVAHAQISYDNVAHDDWLITPKLAPTAANHIFSFYARRHSSDYNDRFNVKVSTTTADIASFTHTLATNVLTGATDYLLHSYDLSAFTGQNIYVAIQAISTNQYYLLVDDVVGPDIVPEAPNAPVLISPADGTRVYTGQTLSWTLPAGSATATGYFVYLDGSLVSVNQPGESYLLPSELGEGVHTWYVKARNNIGFSAASETWSFEYINGVIIGTGTSYQKEPFNVYHGYGRSLGLYKAAQIGQNGQINTLSWSVAAASATSVPYKVYAMITDNATISPMTWDYFTAMATVIKEGTHTFDSTGWHEFVLDTPFYYTHGNLLIGVETNIGGAGSGKYPRFHYTGNTAGSHQYWQRDNALPEGNGTLNANLPNLLMTLSPLPADPVLCLNHTQWDYGRIMINTASTLDFMIRNGGDGTLNVTGLSPTDDGFFLVTDAPAFPVALATGEAAYFTIQYLPMAVGQHTATFTVAAGSTTADLVVSGQCYDPIIYACPYMDGFEEGQTDQTPVREWTQHLDDGKTQYWMANSSATNYNRTPHNGSFNATLRYDGNAWLMKPISVQAGTSYDVEIWARQDGATAANASVGLYYGTSPTIEAMTNTIAAQTGIINGDYQRIYGRFTAEAAGIYYIGIHGVINNTPWYISIDDFTVKLAPTAPEFAFTPDAMDFGAVPTHTPAAYQNVTVTNGGVGTLNLTEANISIIGSDAAMFAFDPSTLPLALTANQSGVIPVRYQPTAEGIHSATLRMVYADNNYDVSLSGRAVGENALFEGFESTQFPPPGWSVHNGGGSNTWFRSTTKPHTGVAHARITWDTVAHDDWLITPRLVPSVTNHIFSFYGCRNASQYDDRFNIKVSTTDANVASFTHVIATNVQTGSTSYMYHSFDLSAFIGQSIHVAIQAISTDQLYLMIDDVVGPDIAAPEAPVLLSPANGAHVVAGMSLDWTLPAGSAGITGYDVYIDGNLVSINQSSTSYTIPTLSLGTHTWYVVVRNNVGTSTASEIRSFIFANGVVIGTGTDSQTAPFNAWFGYGRSLGLYTANQIGQLGQINTLGWNVADANSAAIPYKIYAKLTTVTTLSQMTWDAFVSGATLVKEGTHTFNTAGWNQITLDTAFAYTGGNLIIGVEANYGGSGTGSYPSFYYTTGTAGSHQYWQQDGSVPTGNGTLNASLPNLVMKLSPLSEDPVFVIDPTGWNFGSVMIYADASKTFTITNSGNGTLEVTDLSPATSGFFSVTNAPAFPLELTTGQSASFDIKYAPTATGNHTATFTITHGGDTTDIIVSGECFDPIIYAYPFSDGFEEGQTDGAQVQEWTQYLDGGRTRYWMANSSATNYNRSPRNGSFNATLQWNGNAWLMRPFMLEAGQSYDVEVWARQDGGNALNASVGLYYGTASTTAAMSNTIVVQTGLVNGDYQRIIGCFTPQTAGVYWIGIHGVINTTPWYISIDDFRVKHSPTEPEFAYTPDNLNFETVYTNTATAWQNVTVTNAAGGTLNLSADDISFIGADAAMFELDTSNLPLALPGYQSGIIPVRYHPTAEGVHSATLRMVSAGENYDVALSGNAVGEFALMESFEGTQFPPLGWGVINGGGSNTWFRSTAKPRTGAAHAQITHNSTAHDDWLITPRLAPSATNHIFRFHGCNNTASYQDRFNVLVSTTNPDIASFTHTLATDVQTGSTTYQQHAYDLSEFIGQEVFVAIQAISANQWQLLIDDVSGPDIVIGPPSPPTLLAPANGANLAPVRPTLVWSGPIAGSMPPGYKVYFGTENPPTTEVADVATTQFTFQTSLLTETAYYWAVK
ncbi:MAG: choice-of-anchor J domain-containing protein, partial [Candidatus Cloacimonadaceae bacterium]